jgi:hypothetical protein
MQQVDLLSIRSMPTPWSTRSLACCRPLPWKILQSSRSLILRRRYAHHRPVAPYRPEAAMKQHGRRSPATSSAGSRHTPYQSAIRWQPRPYHTGVAPYLENVGFRSAPATPQRADGEFVPGDMANEESPPRVPLKDMRPSRLRCTHSQESETRNGSGAFPCGDNSDGVARHIDVESGVHHLVRIIAIASLTTVTS